MGNHGGRSGRIHNILPTVMTSYSETLDYLYSRTPQFQQIGAAAYKPGLDTARRLDDAFGNPHRKYPAIHIAGTNGKGSTAHTLAAVLQSAGYRVGLYTSPHLIDFRERIRVNGEMIPQDAVTGFVERYRRLDPDCSPSFFELTTIMAFDYFAACDVDVAVIETGLGGRLDTTNIITPCLSIITNISFDHTVQLGNTLRSIAFEKAGIIKPGIPVVIGEAEGDVREVFAEKAHSVGAPITFSEDVHQWTSCEILDDSNRYTGTAFGDLSGDLTGECQIRNAATILTALSVIKDKFHIKAEDVANGMARVCRLTGLRGRWSRIADRPLTVCDTGHNTGGWQYTRSRLAGMPRPLTMVIGFVSDKDIDHILPMMPADADYCFTQASIPRAMPAEKVAQAAARHGLKGIIIDNVADAYRHAVKKTSPDGSIFIGGSTFVVADLFKHLGL